MPNCQIAEFWKINKFANIIKNFDKYFCPLEIYNSIYQIYQGIKSENLMEWIPYSQFTNVKEIAKGGFGIIHTPDKSIRTVKNN